LSAEALAKADSFIIFNDLKNRRKDKIFLIFENFFGNFA
jgi:hypothetical protein